MDFALRLLTKSDLPPLLEFERTNRCFFERYVPPRPEAFFTTPNAFTDRMAELLLEQALGRFLMFILLNQNEIIGRVNLTVIENHEAMLGYRLAEKHTGNGFITRAIERLSPIVMQDYKLAKFSAFAAPSNPASVQTLIKAGFRPTTGENREVTLNNAPLTLHKFEKTLGQPGIFTNFS